MKIKKLTAMILSAAMALSLAACSSDAGNSGSPSSSGDSGASDGKQDKIVLWTLAKDLQQFADRYTNETGNEVEVVVFDSADFQTKIMQGFEVSRKDVR